MKVLFVALSLVILVAIAVSPAVFGEQAKAAPAVAATAPVGAVAAPAALPANTASGAGVVIAAGKQIKIDYSLSVNGQLIDSSEQGGPIHFEQGKHQVIPGLERQLEGLKVGDEREITVKPEEGYGPVNPKAFAEVQRSKMPKGDLKIGMQMQTTDKNGQPVSATVSEIKKDKIIMNFNHPLAGKELHFKIKVVEIV